MKKKKLFNPGIFISIILVLSVTFLFCERENERTITETEVPRAVIDSFNTAYPNARVREYTEEREDGKKRYEISFDYQGAQIDVSYDTSGRLLESEETLPADQLPDKMRQAITGRFPQFAIKKVERISKQGTIVYEIKITDLAKNKEYELTYSGDGKLIEEEAGSQD